MAAPVRIAAKLGTLMTGPLRLPAPVKKVGRTVRDFPLTNNLITSVARPLLSLLPERLRRSVIAHVPRVGKAQAKLPNGRRLRMFSPEPESILNGLFYDGWTADEAEVLPLWFALAEQADVVVDIGAHVGHFSLVAAHANREARVYSFEPLPRVAALLRANLKLNGLSNVEVRQRALGRVPGKVPFYAVPEGIPSSSSLSKDFMLAGDHMIAELLVEVSTLDAEGIAADKPIIMKIDTETTEPDVIAGGAAFIGQAQPLIIVEVLDSHDTGELLASELAAAGYGFFAYLLTGDGPVRRDRLVAHPQWRNYLLVPHDHSRIGGMGAALSRFGITDNR